MKVGKIVLLCLIIFSAIVFTPFLTFYIQSKTVKLDIKIGEQTIRIKGFFKYMENSEKATFYHKGDPIEYFLFTKKIKSPVFIEIGRIFSEEVINQKASYALGESWSGVEAGEQLLLILIQDPSGEILTISLYGKEKKVKTEREVIKNQLNQKGFTQTTCSNIFKRWIGAKSSNGLERRWKQRYYQMPLFVDSITALEKGDRNLLTELLRKKNLINKKAIYSDLLHLSVGYFDDFEMLSYLLKSGANINYQNKRGYTPLMIAIDAQGRAKLVEFLLLNGADPNVINKDDLTALHIASYFGNKDVVNLLIKYGANLEIEDDNGLRALHQACYGGYADIVKSFIEAGADVNAKSKTGLTPLHLAAIGGDVETVKLLLNSGANPLAKDNSGKTPLDKADFNENYAVKKLLSKYKE